MPAAVIGERRRAADVSGLPCVARAFPAVAVADPLIVAVGVGIERRTVEPATVPSRGAVCGRQPLASWRSGSSSWRPPRRRDLQPGAAIVHRGAVIVTMAPPWRGDRHHGAAIFQPG
jgi:hypothetical protein